MSRPSARRGRALALWLPVPAYIALVYLASAFTVPTAPLGASDKLLHVIEYSGLGVVVARALTGQFPRASRTLAGSTAWSFALASGAIDEWIQSYAPLRTSDLADLAADALGAAIGVLFWLALDALWRRRRSATGPQSRQTGRDPG